MEALYRIELDVDNNTITMINDLTYDFDHVYIELENNNRIIKLVSHD